MRSCELCGHFSKLEIHHVDWHHANDLTENRMTLCRHCHVWVHKVGYLSKDELMEIRQKVVVRGPRV